MRKILVILLILIPIFIGSRLKCDYSLLFERIRVKATCYYPSRKQCDRQPLITSNGSIIDKVNPLSHRWVAVSRDLLKSHLRYGDWVYVSGTGIYDGWWMVNDKMNKRFKHTIDFLVGKDDPIDMWANVEVRINN